MSKKYYAAIAGLAAIALALAVRKIIKPMNLPLKRTIKHIKRQELDSGTFGLLVDLEERLRTLPIDVALAEAQSCLDGEMPIGNLGPGDYTQLYHGLRFEPDGSVYFDLKR